MSHDQSEADRILGENWIDPRQQLLLNALETHPERELIAQLQQETDKGGERHWSLCRQLEDDELGRGVVAPVAARPVRPAASDQGRRVAHTGSRD